MPRIKFAGAFLLAFVIGVSGWIFYYFILPGQGPVVEEWQSQNSKLQIRVQRRPDLYGFGTYYYIFQAAPKGSNSWREIIRQLHDEPIPLPKSQVRFVSDDVAFVFMNLKYAVTTDGGNTWSVFDFKERAPLEPQKLNYSRIADVNVLPNGNGTLTMFAYDEVRGAPPLFHSLDYGQTWSIK